MAGTSARAFILGRMGADPELKYTNSGTALINVRLATDRQYRAGQDQETDWHSVVVWGRSAEYLAERGHRGDLIQVFGRIVQNTWTTDDGQKRERTEVHTSEVIVLGRLQNYGPAPEANPRQAEQEQMRPEPAGQAPGQSAGNQSAGQQDPVGQTAGSQAATEQDRMNQDRMDQAGRPQADARDLPF